MTVQFDPRREWARDDASTGNQPAPGRETDLAPHLQRLVREALAAHHSAGWRVQADVVIGLWNAQNQLDVLNQAPPARTTN
ncbi:hypothetical protein MOQ72_43705 [Saccharopolyspora sp. K220]|uniref:hypothetical protein n=1 Tax=Saccharopolyspora soli TaxID=2926618 RepID=UPI001F56D971|nr:hypothetical protein [Saccharopolyspora soli]MCI2424318.1 hypothetical protein [Saccharopolyspora soli]